MVSLYYLSLTCRSIPYRRAGFAKSRSVHARGFTARQKNCGKSGLGHQDSGPPGSRAAGPPGRGAVGHGWAFGPPGREAVAGRGITGRGPRACF